MEMTSHEGHDVFMTWGFVVRVCPRFCFFSDTSHRQQTGVAVGNTSDFFAVREPLHGFI